MQQQRRGWKRPSAEACLSCGMSRIHTCAKAHALCLGCVVVAERAALQTPCQWQFCVRYVPSCVAVACTALRMRPLAVTTCTCKTYQLWQLLLLCAFCSDSSCFLTAWAHDSLIASRCARGDCEQSKQTIQLLLHL